MNKIATHDSATGEQGLGLISLLFAPFACTLSKTIKQLYEAGCRMFDIRIRLHKGEWVCAHGFWVSKRTAYDILKEINEFPDRCIVWLTYEGDMDHNKELEIVATEYKALFTHIIWGGVAVKYGVDAKGIKVKYTYIMNSEKGAEGGILGFLPLDGRSWHTYVPIPWLWDRIYKRPHVFNEETYTYVDFL